MDNKSLTIKAGPSPACHAACHAAPGVLKSAQTGFAFPAEKGIGENMTTLKCIPSGKHERITDSPA